MTGSYGGDNQGYCEGNGAWACDNFILSQRGKCAGEEPGQIEQAIEELGFEVNEVARGLKTNRTKMVGVILPELNNIFFAEIITELEDVLRSRGYAVMICDCRTDEKREAEAVEF